MRMAVFALLILALALGLLAVALVFWRLSDGRATRAEMARLQGLPAGQGRFDPAMVADLPEPAQRFFRFAIAPGTPLFRRVTVRMEGQMGLGGKDAPGYVPFTATQLIAVPEGFVWALDGRMNGLSLRGSDTGTWTRFWVGGLVPVARAGGTQDHRLSAFGRYMAEAALWVPTALLPSGHVRWSSPGPDLAQFDVRHDGLELRVVLDLDPEGRPKSVQLQRWSNANPEKTYRFQSFGGYAFEWRRVQGVQVATRVEAGNFFGSDAYFPFFKARVRDVTFE